MGDTKVCEVCGENEAHYEGHYEEHIPNPREIDVCRGCHSKIHSSWKWIMRERPNACPINEFMADPDKMREEYDVEGKGIACIEEGACWYPAQFYTDMATNGTEPSNSHPCSEIEKQFNFGKKEFDYVDCPIFSKWYWMKYFETLEEMDNGR